MKIGICTIEKRLDNYTKDLVNILKESCIDIKLFVDYDRKGHSWNYRRMMTEMLENAKQDEKILLCMDDVITIPEWKEYLDWLVFNSKTGINVLFNRKRWHFKQSNLDRGFSNAVHKGSYYDQAVCFVNQQTLPKKIDSFFNLNKNKTEYMKRRGKHWDIVILDTLKYYKIEYTIATPSLFEHVGEKSTLGHSIGKAFNYIGNNSRKNKNYIHART
tara:strand:- start:120 stop:767 length:648 start_codon:yes stop_codon:yes gene_type:complete